MLNRLKSATPFLAVASISALSLGMVAALVENRTQPIQVPATTAIVSGSDQQAKANDPVLQLVSQKPDQRANQLAELAAAPASVSQNRARYLLALDLIQQGHGGRALDLLDNLEHSYRDMAPYVLLARAQAQTAAGLTQAAKITQQQLLSRYGTDPAAAELLFHLGQQNPSNWDQLLQQFPNHPYSTDVAQQRLNQDPHRADALPLLLTIARNGLHHPEAGAALLRLTTEFADQLSPEDWQTIGFGYWRLDSYAQAGAAYAKAPTSPTNLYRAARGLQIGQKRAQAIALFSRLDQEYPNAPETATGLLRLTLSLPPEQALGVLDQVVNRFPDRAPEAILLQAKELDQLNSPESAQAKRQMVLDQYPTSDAAAELRMKNALSAANAGDLNTALFWVQTILTQNPDSDTAAEAGFWAGKWGRTLGKADIAQQSLKQVIAKHPESYYAWRAAVALGWDVGDFKTVRFENPVVELPHQRTPLPAGSATLTELYLLGQDQPAWRRWQTEFSDRQQPSVAEQFTDGLMRLGQGDNLMGIYMVSNLATLDAPQDKAEYQQLKQKPDYWMAVYPFPFVDLIEKWSAQRQLNPLLVTALIRQESRFEPEIRSGAGATGLMQVMPATANWIEGKAGYTKTDLKQPDANIKLGTWYLDYTHQEYNNHSLFAVASYNAGPGNVAKWIREGGFTDADEFVEHIPFPETRGYVEAVFGGYWNYLRLYNPEIAAQVADYQQHFASSAPVSR